MQPLVLVIDDDHDLRDVLEVILSDLGYHMETCSDGHRALTYLRSNKRRPDVILVDLMMPGMNGREFLRNKRESPELRDIPTLVMSASANLKEEFGEGNYLQKPFDLPHLQKTLRRVLAQS